MIKNMTNTYPMSVPTMQEKNISQAPVAGTSANFIPTSTKSPFAYPNKYIGTMANILQ